MLNSWPLAKDLQVLVEIVHSGSFSAAAATLGVNACICHQADSKSLKYAGNNAAEPLRSRRGAD